MLVMAIISAGIGLAFNSFALPYAISDIFSIEHDKKLSAEFYGPAFRSLSFILLSGVFFIVSLISIVFAGFYSLFKKKQISAVGK
jgi:hypothetical protein